MSIEGHKTNSKQNDNHTARLYLRKLKVTQNSWYCQKQLFYYKLAYLDFVKILSCFKRNHVICWNSRYGFISWISSCVKGKSCLSRYKLKAKALKHQVRICFSSVVDRPCGMAHKAGSCLQFLESSKTWANTHGLPAYRPMQVVLHFGFH